MNEIWEQVSGYIMPIITIILSSGLGAILVRAMSSGWFRKHDLNVMAQQFADKLTGSSIKVDLKAITEKQLDKIDKNISSELTDLREKINMILSYQGDIIECISSSAKLKKEESAKLISDLEGIKLAVTPIEHKEEICIEIKEQQLNTPLANLKTSKDSFIRFD